MDSPSLHENDTVVLTQKEWDEIGDCVIALHEAMKGCHQAFGSAQTIQTRLDRHVNKIANRVAEVDPESWEGAEGSERRD